MDRLTIRNQLLSWAKDDIVPGDLQEICKFAASSITAMHTALLKYRWIPVGERLPEKIGIYLIVRDRNSHPVSRFYNGPHLKWSEGGITHWREIDLPE